MKKMIGIACREDGYGSRLMEYINGQGEVEAFVCTEEAYLKDALDKKRPSVLFREQGFAEEVQYQGEEVYLRPERGGEEGIYQYQPADQLYQIMMRYVMAVQSGKERCDTSGIRICGVYSPLGRCGKTSFSLAYARKHSFFYLSMEEYGLEGDFKHNMGEVAYYIQNRKEGIGHLLFHMGEQRQGIRMIGSAPFFQDMKLVDMEDYRWFFDCLRKEKEFPSVIFDIGTGCLPDFSFLELFDQVYVPVLEGRTEEGKLRKFWDLLLEVYGAIDDRFRIIHVPDMDWMDERFLAVLQERSYKEEYGWE